MAKIIIRKVISLGFSWWSGGKDSVQGAQVQFLAGELRSQMPHGAAKK